MNAIEDLKETLVKLAEAKDQLDQAKTELSLAVDKLLSDGSATEIRARHKTARGAAAEVDEVRYQLSEIVAVAKEIGERGSSLKKVSDHVDFGLNKICASIYGDANEERQAELRAQLGLDLGPKAAAPPPAPPAAVPKPKKTKPKASRKDKTP